MRNLALALQLVFNSFISAITSTANARSAIQSPELWDVHAFLLTKLLNLCSEVPLSFKHFAEAEPSDSCVVTCHHVQSHPSPRLRQTVSDLMLLS